MNARRGAGATKGDDVADLRQGEAEPARLTDKRQDAKHVDGIATVAGRLAPRRWKDAALLVQPESLATDTAARRDLPDQQALVVHGGQPKACPIGQGQDSCSGFH